MERAQRQAKKNEDFDPTNERYASEFGEDFRFDIEVGGEKMDLKITSRGHTPSRKFPKGGTHGVFKFGLVREPCERLSSSFRFIKEGGENHPLPKLCNQAKAWSRNLKKFDDFGDLLNDEKAFLDIKHDKSGHTHFWPLKHWLVDERGPRNAPRPRAEREKTDAEGTNDGDDAKDDDGAKDDGPAAAKEDAAMDSPSSEEGGDGAKKEGGDDDDDVTKDDDDAEVKDDGDAKDDDGANDDVKDGDGDVDGDVSALKNIGVDTVIRQGHLVEDVLALFELFHLKDLALKIGLEDLAAFNKTGAEQEGSLTDEVTAKIQEYYPDDAGLYEALTDEDTRQRMWGESSTKFNRMVAEFAERKRTREAEHEAERAEREAERAERETERAERRKGRSKSAEEKPQSCTFLPSLCRLCLFCLPALPSLICFLPSFPFF
jgi:hypothetical protein